MARQKRQRRRGRVRGVRRGPRQFALVAARQWGGRGVLLAPTATDRLSAAARLGHTVATETVLVCCCVVYSRGAVHSVAQCTGRRRRRRPTRERSPPLRRYNDGIPVRRGSLLRRDRIGGHHRRPVIGVQVAGIPRRVVVTTEAAIPRELPPRLSANGDQKPSRKIPAVQSKTNPTVQARRIPTPEFSFSFLRVVCSKC